ncbi:hypothetical protein OROMI_014048 [Orobanche minor]
MRLVKILLVFPAINRARLTWRNIPARGGSNFFLLLDPHNKPYWSTKRFVEKMLPQGLKMAITDNPKKVANLIDLVNLPTILRDFMGQSQSSQLNCFRRVWSYIKDNNLQDPLNNNVVNCDQKLKSILLGKPKVDLTELPMLIKLHFPKKPK